MSRRRTIKFLSVLAAASLIAAACSSGDDDDAVTEGTSGATTPGTEAAGTTPGTDAGAETTEPSGTEPATTGEGTEPAAPAGAEDVGTVGGSGCGIPHGPYEDPGEPTGEVRVAWNDPLLSFNTQSARGGALANSIPLYLMGLGQPVEGFTYYDGDLNFVNNDSFGTCTVESLDPLEVTYRVNDGVTWSDGTPIDAADLILTWGATSTNFNDDSAVIAEDGTTAEPDADGNPKVLDASGTEVPYADVPFTDEGTLPDGYTYKPSTAVTFDAAVDGLVPVTTFPTISDDGQAVTATWDSFYVDYQNSGIGVGLPAHVVGRLALGIDDPTEAKAAIITAFEDNDRDALKKISETWNTGFDANSLPDDPGIYLSAGPYVLTSYDEVTEMTFEVNPEYDFGPKPKVATIVYKIIGDPTAAVQALENEEIDIIEPQATADILTQLQALESRGVQVETGDGATYEHIDLVFDNGGPFDPATYGGDAEKAKAVRQAFLKTIPRQEIVDRLIVPLNPNAEVRNSFTTVPGAPTYDDLVANNGSDEYADVDIDGAEALLTQAGVTGPVDIRFLFAANNPRRANEYELIRDSAAQAGFNVIDGNSPTWGVDRQNPSLYDAALFGWISTAVAVADTEANFRTDGQNNPQGYSSEVVDGLYDQLKASTDVDEQDELKLQIEQALWGDAFGVTIFQFPDITAYNSTYVDGVSSIPLSPQVFWNFWDWEPAS